MALWLRVLATLVEDQSSVPNLGYSVSESLSQQQCRDGVGEGGEEEQEDTKILTSW